MSIIDDIEQSLESSKSALAKAKAAAFAERRGLLFAQMLTLGWLPKERAPRDGTAFLSWKFDQFEREYSANCIAITWQSHGRWHKTDTTDHTYGGYCNLIEECFDLWQPLPAMPFKLVTK